MSNYKPFVIDKTYTEDCYIAPVENGYAPVRFSFTPCLPVERAKFSDQLDRAKNAPAVSEAALAEELASRIKSWSLCDADGKALDINGSTFLSFRFYSLITRMANIVIWGSDLGDADPEAPHSELLDMKKAKDLAAKFDGDIARANEDSQTKN